MSAFHLRFVRLSGFPVALLGILPFLGGCAESSGKTPSAVNSPKAPVPFQQIGSHRLHPGNRLEEESSVTMTFMDDSLAKPGFASVKSETTHTIARTITVQKVSGMGLALYQEKITRDQNGGGDKKSDAPGPLTGRTLVYQRGVSSWTRTIEKAGTGEPKPAAKVSQSSSADFANDGYFPEERISPGYKWTVPGKAVYRLFGGPGLLTPDAKATAQMIFSGSNPTRGEPVGIVDVTLSGSETVNKRPVTFTATGKLYVSLVTGVILSYDVDGPLKSPTDTPSGNARLGKIHFARQTKLHAGKPLQ